MQQDVSQTPTIGMPKPKEKKRYKLETLDIVFLVILTSLALAIVLPFINVVSISLATQQEYLKRTVLLIPLEFTLENYSALLQDGRVWIGYRTTLLFLLFGVPLNMFLSTSMAYGLSRPYFPFKRTLVYFVVITMLFTGGIVPMYLLMMQLKLINTIWSVVFAYGINTFYLIIMMNYFRSLPLEIMESAKLDGAGEWRIMLNIVLPISMPIIATMTLFYSVDRWNEWFNAMIFIRKNDLVALQLALRSIVIDSQVSQHLNVSNVQTDKKFTDGIKMAAVIITMLPIMCVFPFLQKYFVKGMLVGAIKS